MKEKIKAFADDVVKEMKKVTWPKREELRDSTIVVLAVCGIIIVFVYVADFVVSSIVKNLF